MAVSTCLEARSRYPGLSVRREPDLCRSTERDTSVSSAFREALLDLARDRASLVSVGRCALRGVSRSQDLYTVEREG